MLWPRGAKPFFRSHCTFPTQLRTFAHPCAPMPCGGGCGGAWPLIGCCEGGAGRVGFSRPPLALSSFPPCRSWRAGGARLVCADVSTPLSRFPGRRFPPSLRGIVGVRVKWTRRTDATKWPVTCGRSSRPGRRRSLERALCSSGTGTGLQFCPINAMVFSRWLRAAEPRLGGGRSRSSQFFVRCCSPSSSPSSSPSPT